MANRIRELADQGPQRHGGLLLVPGEMPDSSLDLLPCSLPHRFRLVPDRHHRGEERRSPRRDRRRRQRHSTNNRGRRDERDGSDVPDLEGAHQVHRGAESQQTSHHDSKGGHRETTADDQREHSASGGTQGHPRPNLDPSMPHEIRNHPVDPQHCKQQRCEGKESGKDRCRALERHRSLNDLAHARDLMNR